jgi:hypothetical protein
MKVTHKLGKLSSLMSAPADMEKDNEVAPSLYMHRLPKEIEGLPEKGHFEAHIKGKVRRHQTTTEDGKTHHSYDCDVHDFECKNKREPKKKKSTREEVDEAFEKNYPKDEK